MGETVAFRPRGNSMKGKIASGQLCTVRSAQYLHLVKAVRGADKQSIVDARVFDVFAGAGVPEGKKSLAIEVTLQPDEKSFAEAEIKALSDKIVAAAAKQGAELRG